MVFYFIFIIFLPYSIGQNVEKTKLKNELLANLNKYSEQGTDVLEALGTPPQGTDQPAPKEPLGTPSVPAPPPSPSRNNNNNNLNNGLLNLFQPQNPSSIFGSLPNLFNGLLPLQFTTLPPPPSPLFRSLGIQPLPFGQNRNPPFRQHQMPQLPPPPTTPPPQFLTLPTLLPFFVQNGVPQELSPSSFQSPGPLRPLSSIDNVATVRPKFINYTIPPPLSMPTVKSMSEAVSDNIRDWRQRFYKAFKKLSGRGPFPSSTFPPQQYPPLKIQNLPSSPSHFPLPLPRPATASNQMQPVIVFNETNVSERNLRNNNNHWITEQKVKTYARDSKGRIVRLFGVESSGYRFNNSNTNGFIPIPDPPALLSQSVDIGPVYIPAARPSTSSPYYNSYPATLPPPPIDYVAPMLPSPLPTSAVYTVQMPAPPSVSPPISQLGAYPISTFGPLPPPRDEAMTQEVDGLEYDNNDSSPCDGCENTNFSPGSNGDQWLADNSNGILENNEKCNSLRLRYIIQESIVNSDAEASKRAIQLRAETELNTFFNVICGTGFFSYIAHTDEFCQASAMGINCYVFSP
uniref:Ground-like domain-containing protein n=1 Tax=Panagrolaimus sp. ES5 TaxID=591445 RepID=A0AC34FUI6_9BILA